MKRISLQTLLVCVFLFPVSLFGRNFDADIKKWTVVKAPDKASKEYDIFSQRANLSDHDWVVDRSDGKLRVRHLRYSESTKPKLPNFDTTAQLQDRKTAASQCLKVEGGWIAAYNKGEFGSAIYWFSTDGTEKKKLSEHQINEFLCEGDRVFAVEGLSHLSISRGSMIEIVRENGIWMVKEFLPLPSSAQAIAPIASGEYVIVTSDSLLRVNLKKEILMLIPNANWGDLYPNSIEVDDGYIYIGMRQFVARCRITKSVETYEFLLPDTSWLSTRTEP